MAFQKWVVHAPPCLPSSFLLSYLYIHLLHIPLLKHMRAHKSIVFAGSDASSLPTHLRTRKVMIQSGQGHQDDEAKIGSDFCSVWS